MFRYLIMFAVLTATATTAFAQDYTFEPTPPSRMERPAPTRTRQRSAQPQSVPTIQPNIGILTMSMAIAGIDFSRFLPRKYRSRIRRVQNNIRIATRRNARIIR